MQVRYMPDTNGDIAAQLARALQDRKSCEAKLRIFMDTCFHGILVVNAGGVIRFANQAAATILRCTPGELLDEPCGLPLTTGTAAELTVQTRDGRPVVLEVRGTGTEWDDAPAILLQLQDITARTQAAEALRESEEKFCRAFQAMPALLSISSLADGRYIEVNEVLEETLGFGRDELIGRTVLELDIWENPTDRARLVRLLRDGTRVRDFEIHLRGKTGAVIVGALSAEIIHVKGEECLLALTRDITGIKHTEEKLRKSEQQLAEAQRLAHLGSWEWNVGADALTASAELCRIFGVSPDELDATYGGILKMVHPDDRDEYEKVIQVALAGQTSYDGYHRIIRPDGTVRTLHSRGEAAADDTGKTAWLIGACQDVTEHAQAVEALRESEERYRSLVELAPDAIIIQRKGRFLYANEAALRLYGAATFELLRGKDVIELIHPDERDAVRTRIRMALNGERVPSREFRMLTLDGREVPVEATGTLITFEGRAAVLSIIRDISARKRAEQEREQVLVQLDAVLNSIHEGVVIADLEGNLLTMNPAALALHEYESADQVRRQLLELQDTFDLFDLAGKPLAFEQWPMARVLCAERFVDYEVRVRRKDTGKSWIGSYSGTPVYNASGDIILAVITLRDITARKQAEEELRHSEERYRSLYNETPVMLHSIDHDGRLISVSDYWLDTLGYGRSEVLGRRTTEFLTEQSRRFATEVVLPEFFRTGSCTDVPYQIVKKNGETMDVLLSAIAERDSEGKVARSLAVMIDVTDRRRAEEEIEQLNTDLASRAAELEAANRELLAFSYSVSHDLRRPLTTINGYCQIIREMCDRNLDEQCRGYLREIYDGTMRMNQLIDALLRFSSLTRVELHRETVDLSGMAQAVAAELRLAEPERRVSFRIAQGITVTGDSDLLRVVVENLLGNAWKYTGRQEEGSIEFDVTEIDGKPACFVRDNGAGFAMEEAGKLFHPFQRLSGAADFKGHGIGLATVERIIKRHGGRVWAEGEPGKGATFYFTL